MSYAIVSGIGQAKAAQQCAGGEVSESGVDPNERPERCCPTKTWSNATYRRIKGTTSWQYYNEQRLRIAFHLLLGPAGPYPTGIEAFAARGLALPPGLVGQVRAAARNFDLLLPASRWKNVPNAIPTECQDDGFYSAWRTKPLAATPTRLRAIQQLSKAPVNAADLEVSYEQAAKGSGPYARWLQNLFGAVNQVPGSHGSLNRSAPPRLEQLLVSKDGRVALSPAMAHIVSALSGATPFLRASLPRLRLRLPTSPQQDAGPAPTTTRAPPEDEKRRPFPWWWVLGGAAVVGAVGYAFTRD